MTWWSAGVDRESHQCHEPRARRRSEVGAIRVHRSEWYSFDPIVGGEWSSSSLPNDGMRWKSALTIKISDVGRIQQEMAVDNPRSATLWRNTVRLERDSTC